MDTPIQILVLYVYFMLPLFNIIMLPCTTQGLNRNVFQSLVLKKLTGLHRGLTSTSSHTFWINWNTDFSNGLAAGWEQIPAGRFQNLWNASPTRVERIISAWVEEILI